MDLYHSHKNTFLKERLPKVSCMCVTYGRTKVLDEAVYSFLIQDYPGEKELIILNDLDRLELEGTFPGVIIYNEKKRYGSLGIKTNECISRCSGEIILIWDDDDISLPNRMSVTVSTMKNRPFFKPSRTFFYNHGKEFLLETERIPTCSAAYTKAVWEEVEGFPDENSGLDQVFEQKLIQGGMYGIQNINDRDTSFIYRWFVVPGYHTSAYGWGKGKEEAEAYVKKNKIEGVYTIKPQWYENYEKLAADAIQKNLFSQGHKKNFLSN